MDSGGALKPNGFTTPPAREKRETKSLLPGVRAIQPLTKKTKKETKETRSPQDIHSINLPLTLEEVYDISGYVASHFVAHLDSLCPGVRI